MSNLGDMISIKDAAILYKVTTRTVQNWIAEDGLKQYDNLYDLDALQKAHDKRRNPKPRLRYK